MGGVASGANRAAIIEPYTLLRVALSLFQKSPGELGEAELQKVERQALNEYRIETRVINSAEAAAVIVTEQEIEQAMAEVRERFNDEEHFLAALRANKLDPGLLRAALTRQCKVNAVLERVASRAPKVNEVEVGIFYHSHIERFHQPERRQARHILISINPDYPENTRERAWARMREIEDVLRRKPHKFDDLALKNSECPTALNGGDLGVLPRGKLYPELDAVLFDLKEREISGIVETEVGLHVIQCLQILPAETLSLKKATPKIREVMQERYRRTCQRAWLAGLPAV